jgi:3',5'-cyclic AMP phosphodiesterase CpdA
VTRIAHISDLHFGRHDPAVVSALRDRVVALAPDLLVVSGDLTQRATPSQWRDAIAFLDSIPCPRLVVAGNHDLTLTNPFERFLDPTARFRRFVRGEPEPSWTDGTTVVVGLHTPRPIVRAPRPFTEGAVSQRQIDALGARLEGAFARRIVVMHHPPVLTRRDYGTIARPLVGSRRLLDSLARFGVDLVLYGHLHVVESSVHQGVRCVMASTACSTRRRADANGFNFVLSDATGVTVEHQQFVAGVFVQAG